MRFVNFMKDGRRGIAAAESGRHGFRGLMEGEQDHPGSLDELLASGADLLATGSRLLGGRDIDLGSIVLLPPLLRPPKILCLGLNYADHAAEAKLETPEYPEIFARFPTSVIGHGAPIVRPHESATLDFEAELAVVVGRGGRRIPVEQALGHVAGYAAFNDATLRDYQLRTSQWTMGKNFDRTGAFGPWLVTPDELPEGASGLDIVGRLNGEVVQRSNTRFLIFDVANLIAIASSVMTLEPGDVFLTGTPGGVGVARDPKLFMKSGDRFEVEIARIGTLMNDIVDE